MEHTWAETDYTMKMEFGPKRQQQFDVGFLFRGMG